MDTLSSVFNLWQGDPYFLEPDDFGIVFDLQLLPDWNGREKDIKNFIAQIHAAFSQREDGAPLIYLKLPYYLPNGAKPIFEHLADIEPKIDLFILQGNWFPELFRDGEGAAGFESPEKNAIRRSAQYYTDTLQRRGVPPGKLVIHYPMYGIGFRKQDNMSLVDNLQPIRPNSIFQDLKSVPVYTTAGFARKQEMNPETGQNVDYYYVDSTALHKQSEWLHEFQFAGIGINGIGYYDFPNPSLPLWREIANQYGFKPLSMGWAVTGFFFFLAFLGFPYSIYKYWEVRNIYARFRGYFLWSALIAFVLLLFSFIAVDIIPKNKAGVTFVMVVLGFFALIILLRKYIAKLNRFLGFFGVKKKVGLKKLP